MQPVVNSTYKWSVNLIPAINRIVTVNVPVQAVLNSGATLLSGFSSSSKLPAMPRVSIETQTTSKSPLIEFARSLTKETLLTKAMSVSNVRSLVSSYSSYIDKLNQDSGLTPASISKAGISKKNEAIMLNPKKPSQSLVSLLASYTVKAGILSPQKLAPQNETKRQLEHSAAVHSNQVKFNSKEQAEGIDIVNSAFSFLNNEEG